jgi:hypothetical protein
MPKLNKASQSIVRFYSLKFNGFTFTQGEADAIKEAIQRTTHPGKRPLRDEIDATGKRIKL